MLLLTVTDCSHPVYGTGTNGGNYHYFLTFWLIDWMVIQANAQILVLNNELALYLQNLQFLESWTSVSPLQALGATSSIVQFLLEFRLENLSQR